MHDNGYTYNEFFLQLKGVKQTLDCFSNLNRLFVDNDVILYESD